MKTSNFSLFLPLLLATGVLVQAQNSTQLAPLTTFGDNNDGSILPGATAPYPPLDSAYNQRGISYDPVTGSLVLVDSHSGNGGSQDVRGAIYILSGATGTNLLDNTGNFPRVLNTNGMGNVLAGGWADASVAVADDGVVYVANHIRNTGTNGTLPQPLIIYRWDSVLATNPPLVCFSNNIFPAQRYGANMDIRGSGTNTEIIMGSRLDSGSGTNVVLFKTADGTNFNAIVLATDASSADFGAGIAFGYSNTFWAKQIGSPLRLMSYNLTTNKAVTLRSFTSAQIQGVDNLGPISVDTNLNLLAAIEEAQGTDSGGPERVRLYDISGAYDPTKNPLLLDIRNYGVDVVNAQAPPGYLDFGGGKLYTHVINNGMITYSVASLPTPPPTIADQPASTNRVGIGASLSLTVAAYPSVSYQWKSNGVPISGATNSTLALANIQTNAAANYTCTITNVAGSTNTSDSYLVVVNPFDLFHLSLLWRVGTNDAPYFNFGGSSGTPNQRTMAYGALSNHLYVVSRGGVPTSAQDALSSNYTIFVLNATNGNLLYTLNTNGVQNYLFSVTPTTFGIALCGIGVGDDGAVYACTEAPYGYGNGCDPNYTFKLYRWASADSTTPPVKIFECEPSPDTITNRWGDIMAVRGKGTNTQVLIDINAAPAASPLYKKASLLYPSGPNLNNTWNYEAFLVSASGTSIGRSLEFDGTNNNIWQKRRSALLIKTRFDPSTIITPGLIDASTIVSYSGFPTTLHGVGQDSARKLAAGVNEASTTITHTLNLYDMSNPNSPLLLGAYNFPPNTPLNQNANSISQTFFSGDLLFTLDANNGIMVCKVVSGPATAPQIVPQPQNLSLFVGDRGSLISGTFESATLQWQKFDGLTFTNIPGATNTTFVVTTNAQFSDAGSFRLVATNSLIGGSVSSTATVTVSLPTLNIAPAGANVLLSWTTNFRGGRLQGTPTLVPTNWSDISTGTVVGVQFQATDATTSNRFYRLIR